jgi:hypothetical protein
MNEVEKNTYTPELLEQMNLLAINMPLVKTWVEAVEKKLTEMLEAGVELPNAYLAPKRPSRKWHLEGEELILYLTKFSSLDVVAPRKPLSPSEAEKVLGKKLYVAEMAEQVYKESSGLALRYKNSDD